MKLHKYIFALLLLSCVTMRAMASDDYIDTTNALQKFIIQKDKEFFEQLDILIKKDY